MSLRKKRGYRQVIESDLDTLPLMGLFVVLIPMLLLSAVFLEISVIDLHIPDDDEIQSENKDLFSISVRIGEEQYVVEAKGYPQRVISRDGEESVTNLLAQLADISARHPDHHSITIISRSTTRYEDIITVMDVSRDAGLPHASLIGEGS
jgi:biopolymer transport protein ExbD